jgi:hypothetical protein
MPEPIPSPIKRVYRLLTIASSYLFLLLVLGFMYARCAFPELKESEYKDSLLGGPGGVTMLAIIVALSAYLRAVVSTAEDRRDKLSLGEERSEGASSYSEKAREERIKSLQRTSENLRVAAPFLMFMGLALTIRLWLESMVRAGLLQCRYRMLRIFDFLLIEWLLMAFVALCVLHFVAWHREERIRAMK